MDKTLRLVEKETYWAFEYFDDRFNEYKELNIGTKEDLLSLLNAHKNEDGTDQLDSDGNVVNGIYPFTYTPEGE